MPAKAGTYYATIDEKMDSHSCLRLSTVGRAGKFLGKTNWFFSVNMHFCVTSVTYQHTILEHKKYDLFGKMGIEEIEITSVQNIIKIKSRISFIKDLY